MAEGVSFSSVCDVLASVTEASGREEKTALLEKLFSGGADGEECSGGELPPASRCASELSFAIMRIVLPELDKERASYGMREKSLGDMIAQLLQLTRGGAAAERLRKWRDPVVQARTGGAVTAAGNFTAVLANVLEGRCSSTSSMSLRDVNDLLDRLNRCEVVYASRGPVSYGGSAGEERRKILRTFLSSLTDREVVWVTKVILKDMKLRIGYEAILRWFHPAALAHYKGTHNLALVCKECADPAFRIEAGEHVTLGAPALPMLCHRLRDAAQLHEVARCMPDGFYLEPKYDGERLQLHKMGGDVRCFSRNALETTDLYGSWLRDAVLSSVHAADCVLDGEVLLWNDGLGAFEKFERIRSYVSGADRSDSDAIWVKYMVFDVLYVDQRRGDGAGRVLDLPLRQRREILLRIVDTNSNIIGVAHAKEACSVSQMFSTMEEHISRKYEGTVIKNTSAGYTLGGRDIGTSVKMKPDYLEGGLDDLDMVILGGYYGGGSSRRRAGVVSHFLLGVRKDTVQPTADGCIFCTVGRVGTGYSLDELKALNERLGPYWTPFDVNIPPEYIDHELKGTGKDVPDVVIDPRRSEVLQVKAYELNTGAESSAGITMRFPRVKRLRPDRGWKDALTLSELRKMLTEQGRRSSAPTSSSELRRASKRRKVVPASVQRGILTQFRAADLSGVTKSRDVFRGKEFQVMGDAETVAEKVRVEQLIHSLGGACVQNMTSSCRAVVAVSTAAVRVKSWVRLCSGSGGRAEASALSKCGGPRDVLLASWVEECAQLKRAITPRREHVLYATDTLRKKLAVAGDKYGDSWTDETDVSQLQRTLSLVHSAAEFGANERAQTLRSVAAEDGPLLVGRPLLGMRIRVVDERDAVAYLLRFFGAETGVKGEQCTHTLRSARNDSDDIRTVIDDTLVWDSCGGDWQTKLSRLNRHAVARCLQP